MDIGSQQRVIIVELDQVTPVEPLEPAELDVERPQELEAAAAWPLPFDVEPEPVR